MILVVGGAGYIGSHVVKELLDQKYDVVVLDNLSTGHKWAVDERVHLVIGDLGDTQLLNDTFEKFNIQAVMHFAASSLVGESVEKPLKYYENNVITTFNLLKMMLTHNINHFVFSSTAATYGTSNTKIIDETHPTNPINPYGRSKLMVEQMVEDFSNAYGLNYTSLRYFNAAGTHKTAEIGEDHDPETHLIPLVLQHLLGKRDKIYSVPIIIPMMGHAFVFISMSPILPVPTF